MKFDAWRVANVFVDTVVKHHGFFSTLVSDRDSVFLNEAWEHLLRLMAQNSLYYGLSSLIGRPNRSS